MEKNTLKKLHSTQQNILDEIDKICKKNKLKYFLLGGTLLGAVRHKGFIPWDDDLDIGMPREDFDKFVNCYYKELDEKYILDYHNINPVYCFQFAKVKNKKTIFEELETKKYKGNKGIWVDIFPIDNAKDLKITKIQKTLMKIIRAIMLVKLEVLPKNKFLRLFVKILSLIFSNKVLGKLQEKIMSNQNNNTNKYYVNFGSQYNLEKQTHLIEKYYPLTKIEFEGKKYNVPKDWDYVLKNIYGDKYMELPPLEKRITHNPLRIVFEDGEEVIFNEKV